MWDLYSSFLFHLSSVEKVCCNWSSCYVSQKIKKKRKRKQSSYPYKQRKKYQELNNCIHDTGKPKNKKNKKMVMTYEHIEDDNHLINII